VSDAECNEGSVWEAAMYAAHHRLGRLTVIVDLNGQQALGKTADVLVAPPMVERWRAFGWNADESRRPRRRRPRERVARRRRPTRRRASSSRDHLRQGRLVHGEPAQVALLAHVDDEYRQALSELDAG
jgi:hypothetical protein